FLRRAGTVILGINILLWFLATYPRNAEITRQYDVRRTALLIPPLNLNPNPNLNPAPSPSPIGATALEPKKAQPTAEQIRAEQLTALQQEESGAKLRYSFAGRMGRLIEPAIAPLGFDWKMGIGIVASFAAREVFVSTMATVYNLGKEADPEAIGQTLREQRRADGSQVYTTLTAVTLMVFYVFALQCVSTVAIVRRETNSWKWPVFQWLYMGALAWTLAFITFQGGRLLGWN
ncbi:MAG TPA: nucleoside recognition domain-containing protein, partial [Verrucomicrobiae bacterium]|nr:nucleoside recognition domain-containing protein [Verrucomicrobiae bacterium]